VTDREVAERAAGAAGAAALARFGGALDVAYKSSGADPVTDADRAAEAAAVAVLRRERPHDAIVGEEGGAVGATAAAEAGTRSWVVDALDGTANFLAGVPHWCSAVALCDAARRPLAAAVADPLRGESFSAAAGEAAPARLVVRDGRALDRAVVATFLRPDKLAPADAAPVLSRLLAATGGPRLTGSGTLELAWVAAGRLDAWVQPDPDPWDWLPGALLVQAAGGTTAVVGTAPAWHVAGPPSLVTALTTLLLGSDPIPTFWDGV
jgi:myo-inositol-1(or 4)-monophosphatase